MARSTAKALSEIRIRAMGVFELGCVDLVVFLGDWEGGMVLCPTLQVQIEASPAQEWLQVVEEVFLRHAEVEVEKVEELSFHEVDLGQAKAKAIKTLDAGVSGPMLVLWTRVVKILSGEDQGSKEDAMDGAAHALGNGRKTRSQAVEVDEGGHQGGRLD